MSRSEDKLIQYLNEAHATELALVTTLRAHISMTPRGNYRTILERHLEETKRQAQRIEQRLAELGAGRNIVQSGYGAVQSLIGQVLSLSKGPIDMLRGTSGEEKLVKNAKDECATEALEIATYDSIETLARELGDEQTAEMAVTFRGQEERMLARLREQIPRLTRDVVAAEFEGDSSYDPSKTGAADVLRQTTRRFTRRAEGAAERARTTAEGASTEAAERATGAAKQARRVPGVEQAEGEIRGAVASEGDLPIPDYDNLKASDILGRLSGLTQVQLSQVDAYERRHSNRKTILARIDSLRGDQPWPGYDEQTVQEIERALRAADADTAKRVRDYERQHKGRDTVMEATGRLAGTAS